MREDAWISDDPAMAEVVRLARMASSCRANVLIVGESGVGKTFIARKIHEASLVSKQGFHTIPCRSSIEVQWWQKDLMEALCSISQLGGTILFKNVSNLSITDQKKLLSLLDRRASEVSPNPDQRLIFTSYPLEKDCGSKAILPELMLRISVITIEVPPLRERPVDIVMLADLFLREYAQTQGRVLEGITLMAQDFLRSQSWEGNIWQLRAVIQNAVMLFQGKNAIDLEVVNQAFKLTDSLKSSNWRFTSAKRI